MKKVAWIGLGNMGTHMSVNLMNAGVSVVGFDISPDAVERTSKKGLPTAGTLAEAVRDAGVVFTMLPKGQHVRQAVEQIWESAAPGTLIIDSSTIDQTTSISLHKESAQKGFRFVDAPVSGGVSGAEQATLAIMAGGNKEDLEEASLYLEPLSARVFHAGGPGSGLAAKIANNMMLMIGLLAISEGSQLAHSLGLDAQVFWDIVSVSSGASWAQQTWYPVPDIVPTAASNNNFEAGFTTGLALKDVNLALEAGESVDLNLSAARLIASQLSALVDEGYEAKDCTLVAKFVTPDQTLEGWSNS